MGTLRRLLAPLFLLAIAGLPVFAAGGGISISAEVTDAAIAFEGEDTLTVSLTWEGEPFLYQIDDFPMPAVEKFKVLGSSSSVASKVDPQAASGEITTRTFRYILEPTDFGTGVISPLNLNAKNRVTEAVQELKTGRLTVEIAKPVAKPEIKSGKTGYLIGGGALVIVLGAAIAALIVFKRKKSETPQVAVDGYYCEALQAIKREAVADRKLFYSRVYRLLLNYLEKNRGLELSGKTGEEIMQLVASLEDDAERRHLMAWLTQAQKVKYQPETPSSGDVENSYNEIYLFFEKKNLHA